MQNSSAESPAPKKSLRRRVLRYGIIGLLWIVTLVALLVVEENWRAKRAWESYKAELEAKGEKLGIGGLIPAPVPDDQNFAQTPFLAPLFELNPNRKPGESAWADTNAVNRVQQFANDSPVLKERKGWQEGHVTDLPKLAAGFNTNKNSEAEKPVLSRTQAAEEILKRVEKYQSVLNELQEASKRPNSRFKIRYEDNFAALLPHLAPLRKFAVIYSVRASAELALGHTDNALADIRMTLYLADAIKDEPLLISKLVRIAIVQLALQPVWEGLGEQKWTDAQLAELGQAFSKYDLISEGADAIRGERALGNEFMDAIRTKRNAGELQAIGGIGPMPSHLVPSFFFYQNQLTVNHLYQDVSMPMFSPEQTRVHPELNQTNALDLEMRKYPFPYQVFAKLLFPAVEKATMKIGYTQNAVDLAALACALERYRLAHHQFPSSLEELKPQFIAKIPHDVVNGEPLHYRRMDNQHFIFYSVGWNQMDDGGTIAFTKGSTPSVELKEGDWAWPQYPVK
ncbi:hypothetical protein [Pedosphaera parvula]|uniref:Uncharacterized protein n=1 Tax=Pedosphaera parvula (strain Ellin514) TaxID=320771 RepID=B9XKE0_PEDPL|nr:hypothetical protein [Pedosphaera parvula]EEF59610.1 hypothetical protein Cflav_PD2599 [Pedosphaera parvula Ellin514]